MNINVKPKRYLGIGGMMIPIPEMIAKSGLLKGVSGAKAKAALLSKEERKIHHFIVVKMAGAQTPLTSEHISNELEIPIARIEKALDKLEMLKTFLYRSDGKDINWAYPLSLVDTGHRITVSSGEMFFAA